MGLPPELCLLGHVNNGQCDLLLLGKVRLAGEVGLQGPNPAIQALRVDGPVELRNGNFGVKFQGWLKGNCLWNIGTWTSTLLITLLLLELSEKGHHIQLCLSKFTEIHRQVCLCISHKGISKWPPWQPDLRMR